MAETGAGPAARATQLIGIAIPTLRELRAAILASIATGTGGDTEGIDALRAAGYAGGEAVYDAFEHWLAEDATSSVSSGSPQDLTLPEFGELAARYFHAAGWGLVEFDPGREQRVATLAMEDCWEADSAGNEAAPSCHVTTGMLAAFFGRLAGYPISVMEIECCSAGAECCRFLLGNAEVMAFKWEQLR
ncbi:MAG TPA: 4-vinyl reductase [Gemmatimonadaceae bacterium]